LTVDEFVAALLSEICHNKNAYFVTSAIIRLRIYEHLVFAEHIFTRESSYCFQRVLAIAILSVRLSVTRVDQSKTMQARITKSSPSAACKTVVS